METQPKTKSHYAWRILIACCLINMSALGMTNSNGLFFSEITKELGFKLSELMIHCIFGGLTSAAVLFVVDRVYRKFPLKYVLIASFLLYHVPYMCMSTFHSVWQWCVAAMVNGIGGAFLLYIPVPMLLNNWFIKKKKMALSICFVASGFSGILTSLLLGVLISNFGWRAAYVIRGAILLLLAVPGIILAVKTPAEMGLKPFGYGENAAEDQRIKGAGEIYMRGREKRKKFYWCVALAVMCNLICAMTSLLPSYAATRGMSVVIASYLTSLAMAGNISSKAAMGPLTEKLGIRTSGIIVVSFLASGFLLIAAGMESLPFLVYASFTTGISACANTLIIPNLLDTFAGGDEYVHMLSRCSTGTMFASAFSVTIGSTLYDSFGKFRPVFLIYGLLGLAIIAVLAIVFKPAKKEKAV